MDCQISGSFLFSRGALWNHQAVVALVEDNTRRNWGHGASGRLRREYGPAIAVGWRAGALCLPRKAEGGLSAVGGRGGDRRSELVVLPLAVRIHELLERCFPLDFEVHECSVLPTRIKYTARSERRNEREPTQLR